MPRRASGPAACCAASTFPSGCGRCRHRPSPAAEQQRVNIARGFISDLPVLLLDEPTASLDAANRSVVVELIGEKKRAGVAMVAIVHDDEIRHLIADRMVDVTSFAAVA